MRRLSAAAFAWGAAEATVWFVIPDVLVCYVALTSARRAPRAYLAAVGGALIGSVLLHAASRPWRAELAALFESLPGIRASDIEEARQAVARRGPAALVELPLRGQPIKLYVYQAALADQPMAEVLRYVALNRLARLGASGLVAGLFGWLLRDRIRCHVTLTRVAYLGFWGAFYSIYWARRSG